MKIALKLVLPFTFLLAINAVHAGPTLDQMRQGDTLLEEWRIQEAETLVQSLLQEHSQSGDVHFLNARLQFLTGNYELAWEILKHIGNRRRDVIEFKSLVNRTRKATAGFVSHESDHFVFRHIDGQDAILVHYAQIVLERSYEVLGRLFDHFPSQKVLVEFYPAREPFSQISPLTLQDIVTSGTVALCKYNRIMMISPGSLVRGYNWMDTLSHEYIHYLLTTKSQNTVPLWLHEGIAKYFETHWREGSEFLTPIMETVLARGLANDYLVPLQSMMPSLAKLKTAEDVQLAYAEVSTMVEYMVSLKGEKIIAALVDDLKKGLPVEKAMQRQLGQDLIAFQKNWRSFMDKKKLKSIPGIHALDLRFKNHRGDTEEKDYSGIGSKQTRDWTFLGDVLKSRNFLQAAIIEYQKAIEDAQIFSPILYNKLAGAFMLRDEYEKAEPLLHQALEFYPMFHTTLVNLGDLYYQTQQHEKALDYFTKAVRINPFNPFVHHRLIRIFGLLHKPEEKELQVRLFNHIE